MPSRRIKPPPVHGTWAWLHQLIRAEVQGKGIYRASVEEAFHRMRAMGEQRIEERLEEWCAARRLVLRIVDDQVEVRPRPGKVKAAKSTPSMQDVEERRLF
jgi:hypothetical protein